MNFDARTHQLSHPLAGTHREVGSQSEMVNTTHYVLTVPNPDDWNGPPIYTGDPTLVHQSLVPGRYSAILEDWSKDRSTELTVYVFDNSTVLGRYVFIGGEVL